MLLSLWAFSWMHVSVKMLSYIPVSELIFFRSIFSILATGYILYRQQLSPWGTNKRGLVLRGLLGLSSLYFFFYALHLLPLGTAIIIGNIVPFLTLLFSHWLDKVSVRPIQWGVIVLGFIGVISIKFGDSSLSWLGVVCAVLGAIGTAGAHITVGRLKSTEPIAVVMFYFPLMSLPIVTPLTYIEWVTPQVSDVVWILLMMIGTHIGQWYLTKAYHTASITALSGTYFVGILLSLVNGFFFFDEQLELGQWFGSSLIVLGLALHLVLQKKNT